MTGSRPSSTLTLFPSTNGLVAWCTSIALRRGKYIVSYYVLSNRHRNIVIRGSRTPDQA